MKHTFTTYQVLASFERDGQVIDCSQWEVLGDAYNKRYTDKADAESEAESLQDDVEDNELDPSTTYSVRETTHEIVIDGESIDPFDGEPTNPYNCYCQLYLTLDGERLCIGAMIGARDSDHGTIKASGAGIVRALCDVWFIDESDHQDVPDFAKEAVEEALTKHSWKLWHLVPDFEPDEDENYTDPDYEQRADYDV